MEIQSVEALEILDSRGNPTVQVTMTSPDHEVTAKVPSGASTGQHEAHEVRDNDERYDGRGVQRAVNHVNDTIAERVEGHSFTGQESFDEKLIEVDGTENKSRLGANAVLGCSMAFARLDATHADQELYESFTASRKRLPTPFCNIVNGGEHAGNDLALQEFMIVPSLATSFTEATRIVAETYRALERLVADRYGPEHTGVGDEGGFAPPTSNPEDAIGLIEDAAANAGHADAVSTAIDAAANEFYDADNDAYNVDGRHLSADELRRYYEDLIEDHDVISLEDPFHDDDYESFAELLDRVRDDAQIVADDLTVTNPRRVERAVEMNSADSLLLKVNQVGTVTEAQRAARIARDAGWTIMVSHRSGETCDAFIADFAVGIGASQVKIGAPCRGERTAKFNRLLSIEQGL